MDVQPGFTLRPLSIGEIFDRAVTMYVRNFVPFTLIMLTLLAPMGVARFFVMPDASEYTKILTSKTGQLPPEFWRMYGGILAIGLVALVLLPFVTNAVAFGVASIYQGRPVNVGECFRVVMKRWAPLLGTALLNLMMLLGIYTVSVIMVAIIIGIGFAFVSIAMPLAVIIFIVSGLAMLAVLLFLVVMVLAYSFSMYATTIESAGVVDSVGKGYSRIFNRKELKKSFLMALAFAGVNIGVFIVAAGVGALAEFALKSMALVIVIGTALNAAFYAFSTILVAVYYYDVRTRAEGLDLEVDLSRLTGAA